MEPIPKDRALFPQLLHWARHMILATAVADPAHCGDRPPTGWALFVRAVANSSAGQRGARGDAFDAGDVTERPSGDERPDGFDPTGR